jgi:hypothetical protein
MVGQAVMNWVGVGQLGSWLVDGKFRHAGLKEGCNKNGSSGFGWKLSFSSTGRFRIGYKFSKLGSGKRVVGKQVWMGLFG